MAQNIYLTKLDYSNAITANLLNIEYDGVLYKSLPRESNEYGQIYYGSAPSSLTSGVTHEYPFSLVVEDPDEEGIYLWQERDKSFSISASIPSAETVTTTPCFDKARGYSCTETTTLLTDESVTTAQPLGAPEGFYRGTLAYSTRINASTIKVIFDGAEYVCDANDMGYGATPTQPLPDFSEYPFMIHSGDKGNFIFTETAGTHQVKIETLEESVETSECFRKAVKSVGSEILKLNPLGTRLADISAMADNGGLIYLPLIDESNVFSWHLLTRFADGFTFTPSLPTGATAEVDKNLAGEDEFYISWK